ncbi:MAG: glycoside hydrolase family 16 protein [Bacteroidaceae bacterium]|nr:glycoside hydrolase family 16 protein [Bacteroidaceae bacterium]
MKRLTLLLMTTTMLGARGWAQELYPLNFNPDELMVTRNDRVISSVTFTSPDHQAIVKGWSTTAPFPVYADATAKVMTFKAGETITPSCASKNSTWMYAYVYIDYNRNGRFETEEAEPLELVTQSTDGAKGYASIPSFTLPDDLADGDYRVRFKTDWECTDPGGRYGENYTENFINDNRGQIIDFTLRINNAVVYTRLREETEHCTLYGANGGQLPVALGNATSLTFKVVPMTGYVLDGTLDVVSESGTVSFSEIPTSGVLTADIQGDALIRAHFKQGPTARWHCIFNDEFNKDDYTWDPQHWNTTQRASPTWCRFNSNDPADSVAVQNNGYLSLTTKTIAPNEMRTGNLMTQNLHNFTYGRVEARCKVYPHTGNFPAFWMMPAAQKPNYSGTGTWGGWPHSGEIDIMEQINTENVAYHTIHSHWANGAGEGGLGQTYQKSASESVNMVGLWHIYALEWDAEQLRWYVDGKKVHTYDRIAANDNDSDRQWPFDRPFYVIINQSVGNGGWAANPDFGHTYRMDVDFVRVYQRCEPDAIGATWAQQAVEVRAGNGRITMSAATPTFVRIVTLSGATVFSGTVAGTHTVAVKPGLYVAANRKVMVN